MPEHMTDREWEDHTEQLAKEGAERWAQMDAKQREQAVKDAKELLARDPANRHIDGGPEYLRAKQALRSEFLDRFSAASVDERVAMYGEAVEHRVISRHNTIEDYHHRAGAEARFQAEIEWEHSADNPANYYEDLGGTRKREETLVERLQREARENGQQPQQHTRDYPDYDRDDRER